MSATSMQPQSEPEEEHNPEAEGLADWLANWHRDAQKKIERQREIEREAKRQRELEKTAEQLIDEITTDQLDYQLSRYKKLRHDEEELRERVYFLERQVALAGHIQTPVSLALQLKAEKEKLAKVRDELKELAAELQTILDTPLEERTKIDADRLTQLIDEVKAKREQENIYKRNIYHLEELQAKIGLAVRIDLFNELRLTREKQAEIMSELTRLEQQLCDEWQLEPETVSAIVVMSSQQIREHAQAVALKKYKEQMQSLKSRDELGFDFGAPQQQSQTDFDFGEQKQQSHNDFDFDEPKQQSHNNPAQNPGLQNYLGTSAQAHKRTRSGSG